MRSATLCHALGLYASRVLLVGIVCAVLLAARASLAAEGDEDFTVGKKLHEQGNYKKALEWFRKAADKGHTKAMFNIGRLYHDGRGVKQDHAEAMRWYRKAADKGDELAMCNIGSLYSGGSGVKQDRAEAMRWYRKAADKGLALAMFNIGALYHNGLGVKQDYAEALRWYLKAAARGLPVAMSYVGHCYYDGRGAERNIEMALRYFQESQKRNPSDYGAMSIWLCLGAIGKDKEARAHLSAYRSEHEPKGWPGSILGFMGADIDEAQLLKQARAVEGKKQSERLCEAFFYIGSVKLISGDRRAATSYFSKCIDTGLSDFIEYTSAKAELKRLRGK